MGWAATSEAVVVVPTVVTAGWEFGIIAPAMAGDGEKLSLIGHEAAGTASDA